MKINPYGSIHSYYQSSAQNVQSKASGHEKKDSVEISSKALEMQEEPVPTERDKRIQELQQKIDNGTYEIDERAVAKKLYEFWNGR
ncbi:flagellar biosynthesis anti-sigma factor FlgM [Geomicrobium sp. JCM 19038]|uniref:flagellar biosynthesis anti-sigma factor FlgM n=1 Tax=Geomicrobium sp. JCM 19038 TaxID=1460635 RepID=UPI00045F3232|nr:flagellar biosynthesis anti-sigma factor FlgM [Geomicrobium sp. JCM 19038]GAK07216.1 negative regulator of flagellin synthesis [Geomicrobium sp. JCM 19038]